MHDMPVTAVNLCICFHYGFLHVITINCHVFFAVNFIAVSVVDAYESTPAGTVWSCDKPKTAVSQTTLSTCDRLPEENGHVEDTTGSGNSAPPRKRLKRSPSSSPQNGVEKKLSNSMVLTTHPVSTASVLTPTAAVTPSLCLAQALPLSGRIIGTVWQPVQSQSTTTAVSTSSGIFLDFYFIYILQYIHEMAITFYGHFLKT